MQTNFACDLRFSADTCPHTGHLRLVFCGATVTSRPPRHCVLYSSWRRNSNGLASKMERFSPDFCSLTTHRSNRCRASSTALKAFPVGCYVLSALILRNTIGRMSCGRRVTLPPVVAGHRKASLSNTSSNKRRHFNGPYIPALKDRALRPTW
jgi:hypothetical protein